MTFIDNRNEVKDAIRRSCVNSISEMCGELVSQTARNSRVKTGKTKGSYQYRVDEEKLEGYVGSNYENAIWEELGTGEYALNGNGRKGGWFYVDEEGAGHFTHGKKPNKPMLRAYYALKNKFYDIIVKHIMNEFR